jgi:flagellar hook protein FlgE
MSINSALLAGVSGLAANSSAMAAISQNIANVNTVGYKRVTSEFSTLVNSQSGNSGLSRGAGYSSGGVIATTRHFISQAGQLQRTSSSTDLAISGNGFFVTTEKSENVESIDARLFTRAGAFRVDEQGFLKNTAGLFLQGWAVDAQGNITSDPSDLNSLSSVNVATVGGAAEATTRSQVNANLRSSQPISDAAAAAAAIPVAAGAYSVTANSMAEFNPETGTGVRPDFRISLPVSDSKGGQRTLTMNLLKSATPNQWFAEIVATPASDVVSGAPLANGQVKTGIIAFTQDGRLDEATMATLGADALFNDINDAILTLGASDAAAPAAGAANWSAGLGIANQTVTFDLNTAAGGLTQYDSDSIVQAIITNGTPFGSLTGVEIDEEGFVTANFDNGVSRRIAQVAIATFPSTDSLTSVSENAYRVSRDSGTYNLRAPGSAGAGLIGASQLEASTVDLSAEFTGLITTQRAYSASSKIITTADEMLAELINIKR